MNALLQHRGHNLMGAGRSIAVQNFNEQACILGLGAFYSLSTGMGLSAFGAITAFGVVVAGVHVADPALARQQLRQAQGRGRPPAGTSPARQRAWRLNGGGQAGQSRPRAGGERLRLGRVLVAVPPAAGARPASAVVHRAGLRWSSSPACCRALRPRAWRGFLSRHPQLWLLAAAAGLTNVGFNWAVTVGDVVRVVLLFYLMPAWSVLLAWPMLGERPTAAAAARLLLALAGVLVVLKTPERPGPAARAADWLALLGGFSFALTNILLRG
jgi:hypothetical protein